MTAASLDWEDKGPGGSAAEPAGAFTGSGSGLAATVMQERQASYMYIMPQEHLSSKDSPEVRDTARPDRCVSSPRGGPPAYPRVCRQGSRVMVGCARQDTAGREGSTTRRV